MTPGCLNVFGIEESRPSLPTGLCSPVPRRHPCVHTRTHTHVSFRKAVQSSPAWRNAGETEVTEFPSLSCHLLATCGWLLEVAWAGKGSERGSGLLLLAQEQSQQLQSCCEVMPGAAGVFLQAETDSGGWGGSPSHGGHEGRSPGLSACTPTSPCQTLGACSEMGICTLSSLAPLEEHSIENTGGWAWPPPVSQPLCPGVVDLLRRVQRRQRETSWSWSLAPSPSSPGPLPPWCSCIKVLISSCPRLGAEHALAIRHEAAGDFATVSRRARQEERAIPTIHCPFPKG